MACLNEKKENASLMEAWSYAQYAGETDRERERKTQKTLFQNLLLKICTCVCVQCTLLYKSLQGLTEVLSYFNALKERLHKLQNIFLTEYISLGIRSVPTDSVLGLTDRSTPTRSSASSADPADVEHVSQQFTPLSSSFGIWIFSAHIVAFIISFDSRFET